VKVAAARGTSQELFVSFVLNRQRSVDVKDASGSKLRVFADSFMENDQAFVVETGNRAKLELIEKFMAGMRESGFIKDSIERAKLNCVEVAQRNNR